MADLTLILDALHRGEPDADGALLAQVYAELRQLARTKMAREQPGQTLQPTALVHEAWLRLDCGGSTGEQRFANRAHFFGAAAEAMRHILVDNARRKQSMKHGGAMQRADWSSLDLAAEAPDEQVLAVHEALERLAQRGLPGVELIKLRFFAGLISKRPVPDAERNFVMMALVAGEYK